MFLRNFLQYLIADCTSIRAIKSTTMSNTTEPLLVYVKSMHLHVFFRHNESGNVALICKACHQWYSSNIPDGSAIATIFGVDFLLYLPGESSPLYKYIRYLDTSLLRLSCWVRSCSDKSYAPFMPSISAIVLLSLQTACCLHALEWSYW